MRRDVETRGVAPRDRLGRAARRRPTRPFTERLRLGTLPTMSRGDPSGARAWALRGLAALAPLGAFAGDAPRRHRERPAAVVASRVAPTHASAASCAVCHAAQTETWRRSGHAASARDPRWRETPRPNGGSCSRGGSSACSIRATGATCDGSGPTFAPGPATRSRRGGVGPRGAVTHFGGPSTGSDRSMPTHPPRSNHRIPTPRACAPTRVVV